MSIYWFRI